MDSRQGNGLGGCTLYSSDKGLPHKIFIIRFFKGSLNEKLGGLWKLKYVGRCSRIVATDVY